MDPRNFIKFCAKNEIKCARTLEMLTAAFGESTMSRTQVLLWYNRFKKGWEDVNGDAGPGHLSTSTSNENSDAVKKMILNNHRIPIEEIADDVGNIVRLMPSKFYEYFRHETCGIENVCQICKNFSKNNVAWTSLRRCWRRSTMIQICLKRL